MSLTWSQTEEGSVVIKQTATFDLKSFPKLFREWARDNNYKYNETDFTEKVRGDGREYTIKYEFKRKVTPFVRSIIKINIWILRVNDVKIKDKILQKGQLEAVFDSYIEFDWQEQWESNPLYKFFRYLYIYYIRKQYFLDHASNMWVHMYNLHAKLKTHLNQYVFIE